MNPDPDPLVRSTDPDPDPHKNVTDLNTDKKTGTPGMIF